MVRRRRRRASGTRSAAPAHPFPRDAPVSTGARGAKWCATAVAVPQAPVRRNWRTRSASLALPLPHDAPVSTGARGAKWCAAVVAVPQAPVRRHQCTLSRATHPFGVTSAPFPVRRHQCTLSRATHPQALVRGARSGAPPSSSCRRQPIPQRSDPFRHAHPFGVTGAPVPARRTRKHWCGGREVVRRRRRRRHRRRRGAVVL